MFYIHPSGVSNHMASNLDYYYDVNDTIYATSSIGAAGITAGSTYQLDLGLQDLTDLSGQSSIFVNKVRFKVIGTSLNGTSTGPEYSYGHMVCGVVPSDLLNTDFDLLSVFQDYKAWPMKMGKDFFYQRMGPHASNDSNMQNGFRMSYTFSPRKALLLNREQSIVMCISNSYGNNIEFNASITGQFKRGD